MRGDPAAGSTERTAMVMIVLLAGRAAHDLRLLARQEPAAPRR
jgi:hypothetical protein